jgi:hypothetical protein
MGQQHPAGTSRALGVEIQAKRLVLAELDWAAREGADAQLRTLQVEQHADGAPALALHLANDFHAALVILVLAVAEIQAEDVGAGIEEGLYGLEVIAGRPEGGDDLGMLAWPHFSGFLCTWRRSHGPGP